MGKLNIKKAYIISVLGILAISFVAFGGDNYTLGTQHNELTKEKIKNTINLVSYLKAEKNHNDNSKIITAKSAEDLVREYMIKNLGPDTICEFDHEEVLHDVKYFVVHVYDVVVDHTATLAWYYVNENTGEIFNGTFGDLVPVN